METTQNKNNTLQVLRGLAIIVVLIHHSISRTNVGLVLQSIDDILICFHMPVFFIIAGYLYQNKINKYESMKKGRFLLAKAKHLLVPYVFWTVLLWCGVQIANSLNSSISQKMISIGFVPMSIKGLFVGLLTYEEYYTEHLWFLYVLFLYFLVHSFLGNAGSTRTCMVIGILGGLLTCYIQMPNIVERFFIWFVFFVAGRYIADQGEVKSWLENKAHICLIYILLGFVLLSAIRLVLSFSSYGISPYILRLLKQVVKYTIGFFGVLLLYLALTFLERKWSRVADFVKNIGDYSYDIYLMHNPYIVALGCTVLSSILGLNPLVTIIVATVAGIAIPMIVSKFVIKRFNLLSKIMLGR